MYQQLVRAARAERNSGNLHPLFARRARAIDSTACIYVDLIGVCRIDRDAEYVRVINHPNCFVAGLLPACASVSRLPRKMPRADVDVIGITRIDGDRLDVV